MDHALLLLLITGAVWRVTRLIVTDVFPPAAWLRRHLTGEDVDYRAPDGTTAQGHIGPDSWVPGWLEELWGCPWCVSVWVSAAIVGAVVWLVPGGVPVPWLVWPAVSGAGGWLAARED